MQFEYIPFFLYFIFLIFFIAKFTNPTTLHKKINKSKTSEPIIFNQDINPFLLDAEKKLIALKELFFQELISEKVYLDKTNKIAGIVGRVIKNDIFEFAQKKNNEIVTDLKNELFSKFEKDKKFNIQEANIDELLISIDKKLEKKS